uniref:Uncharacterized protein n=1 Tax=viral metagenome TaxID=1070528 RepID=A0A6H1ZIM2_9ZZZZ
MTPNAGVLFLILAFFAWQFYKHRKAILHNMKLYGEYFANYLRFKVDEKKKRRSRKCEEDV